MRRQSKELLAILKESGSANSYRLLEELGIDTREVDLVLAVSTQPEELKGYGNKIYPAGEIS